MTTHRITVEAPSSHEAIAFMASLVAPHFNRPAAAPAPAPAPVIAVALATDGEPALQPADDTSTRTSTRRRRQKPGITTEPQAEAQPEQPRAIVVLSPDGSTKTYDAIGDAVEGVSDMLDLCETDEAITTLVDGTATIFEQAGADTQKVWTECVQDRRLELQGAGGPAAEDPMPAGDKVGAKNQPPAEMSLDPPDFLNRKKTATLKIDDVRTGFLAMCKATTPATGKLLLDKYEKPRVGELGEDKWSAFYADCKKTSKLDDASWDLALAEAAQIATKK